jgi:hypothetical protein
MLNLFWIEMTSACCTVYQKQNLSQLKLMILIVHQLPMEFVASSSLFDSFFQEEQMTSAVVMTLMAKSGHLPTK